MDNRSIEPPKFNMPQQTPPSPEKVPDAPLPSKTPDDTKLKRSSNKLLIIIIVTVVALLAGVVTWHFVVREKVEDTTNNTQSEIKDETLSNEIIILGEPDTVPYAYKAGDTLPYGLFWREASGGERTEVATLDNNSYISQTAVTGQNVAYAVEGEHGEAEVVAIWLSTNGGRSYQKVIDLNDGDQITSMIFSPDGSGLAVAVVGKLAEENQVMLLNISTREQIGSFVSSQRGVFIKGYNALSSEVIYYEGCYNCDGNTFTKLKKTNFKLNSTETIIDTNDVMNIEVVIRSDFTEALTVSGSIAIDTDGLGEQTVAPYIIQSVNLATGETRDIAIVGEDGGSGRLTDVGYMADGVTPYYTYEGVVASVDEGIINNIFESTRPILDTLYVSKDSVMVLTGDFSDFVLMRVERTDNNSEKLILEGDGNAAVFGISTKQP